jgi:ParB family chromosome partitioning protein
MPRTIERSVPIKASLIHPNPWNPYANKSDRLQDAIAESIGEFDQIQDVVVRPHPGRKNQFQILDGEGRHRTFHGSAEIFCTVIHGLTDAQAKKITIVMDETRASADQKELNALLAELSEDFSIDELVKGLPYEEDYLTELISMGDGDFSVFDGDGDGDGEVKAESDEIAAEIQEPEQQPNDRPKNKHTCPNCSFEF